MISFRKANALDAHAMAALRVDFLCEGRAGIGGELRVRLAEANEAYFLDGFGNATFAAWLAEENDRIVATSGLTIYRLPPNRDCPNGMTGYISNMYTVPAHRKRGIATRLFALIADEAKEMGCERVALVATEMGRPIYEKYGFAKDERSMSFFPKSQ